MSGMPIETNLPFQVPKYSPRPSTLMSRGRILDGTVSVYFLPIDINGNNDWPAAGMLLRLPQVVTLNVTNDDDASGDNPDTTFDASIEAINDVVTRIAALRPGRTWAISNYLNGGYSLNTPVSFAWTFNDEGGIDPFVAVEFLSIWIGGCTSAIFAQYYPALGSATMPWDAPSTLGSGSTPMTSIGVQNPAPGAPLGDLIEVGNGIIDEATLSSNAAAYIAGTLLPGPSGTPWAAVDPDTDYQDALGLFPSVVPRFSKFGVRIYEEPVDPGPGPTIATEVLDGGAGSVSLNGIPQAGDGGIDDAQELLNASWVKPGMTAFSSLVYDQMAVDFAPYNVKVSGNLGDVTSDNLVKQIADFFGFDPYTGIDLPLTLPKDT